MLEWKSTRSVLRLNGKTIKAGDVIPPDSIEESRLDFFTDAGLIGEKIIKEKKPKKVKKNADSPKE